MGHLPLVVALALALLVALPARAADWYVSTSGSGSACTVGSPCDTIAEALALEGAGDTIWISAGTYNEGILYTTGITGGSSWANSLKLKAVGGPVIVAPPAGDRALWLAGTSPSWIEFFGITFDGSASSNDTAKVTCTGTPCPTDGSTTTKHVRFWDCHFRDSQANNGLLVAGPEGVVTDMDVQIYGGSAYANGNDNFDHGYYLAAAGSLVVGVDAYQNSATGILCYNASGSGVDNCKIKHSRSWNNHHLPANYGGVGITIDSGSGIASVDNQTWDNTYGHFTLDDAQSPARVGNRSWMSVEQDFYDIATAGVATGNIPKRPTVVGSVVESWELARGVPAAYTDDYAPVCGDSVTNAPETCDDGDTSITACIYGDTSPYTQVCDIDCIGNVDCANPQYCGDGVIQGAEACDAGGANGTCPAECSATCTDNDCGGPSAIDLTCVATCAEKSSGVCAVPAYVHVDCTTTTHDDEDVRPFHDLRWKINYGDGACASGTGNYPQWLANSPTLPRNESYWAIGAHPYECAGAKTITVDAYDSTGATEQWTTSVTITAENTAWTDANTKCVANGSLPVEGVGGCPNGDGGAVTVQNTGDYDAAFGGGWGGAGKRILFLCGNTFSADADPVLTNANTNGSLISGYGSCTGNPAIVNHTVSVHARNDGTFSGWRVRDMTFNASGAATKSLGGDSGQATHRAMLLRSKSMAVKSCNAPSLVLANHTTWPDLNSTFDYECQVTQESGSGEWANLYWATYRGAHVGSYFHTDNLVGPTNGYRSMGASHYISMGNTFAMFNSGSSLSMQFRTYDVDRTPDQEYVVLGRNRFHDDSIEHIRNLKMEDSHSGTAFTDIMVEGNAYTYGSSRTRGGSGCPTPMSINGVKRLTYMNNTVDMRGLPDGQSICLSYFEDVGGANASITEDSHVLNNTLIHDQPTNDLVLCNENPFTLKSGLGNLCYNNIGYSLAQNAGGTQGSCSAQMTCATNSVLVNSANCPWDDGSVGCTGLAATGQTYDFSEITLRSDAAAKNAGTDWPLLDEARNKLTWVGYDFFFGCRPDATEDDIGSDEQNAAVCP